MANEKGPSWPEMMEALKEYEQRSDKKFDQVLSAIEDGQETMKEWVKALNKSAEIEHKSMKREYRIGIGASFGILIAVGNVALNIFARDHFSPPAQAVFNETPIVEVGGGGPIVDTPTPTIIEVTPVPTPIGIVRESISGRYVPVALQNVRICPSLSCRIVRRIGGSTAQPAFARFIFYPSQDVWVCLNPECTEVVAQILGDSILGDIEEMEKVGR